METKKEPEKESKKIEKKQEQIKQFDKIDKSGIYLWLDSYEDIFSDFDARPYNKRATSADFLDEAKRASMDKEDIVNLQLSLSKEKRNTHDEKIIKDRLHEHFKKHLLLLKEESRKVKQKGYSFTFAGILVMFLATLILFRYPGTNLLTSFLVVFLEPAGWFLFWEGLDLVIFESKRKHPDLAFYKKMANSVIEFFSEEPEQIKK